jgi:phenylalanyl-tRNA synthetase alpha chain
VEYITMDDWQGRITALREQALSELTRAEQPETLEQWRVTYLGRRGALAEITRGLGALSPEQRRTAGQAANEAKNALESALEAHQGAARRQALTKALEEERIDVTLPGRPAVRGGLHPTSIILRQITGFFQSIGYQVVEGPEVELDKYNFEMLNIPANHPARDMWDTLYVNPPEVLMRTHTSPMQARVMESRVAEAKAAGTDPPPVRVIVPGRCYRYEAQDATHEWMFYQV